MKVLIACEFSGIVREAFRARGHDAWSCDLLPTEIPSPFHLQAPVEEVLFKGMGRLWWDLMIAHPPCTRIANSGVRWLAERNLWEEMRQAVGFFRSLLYNSTISRIAVENPIPHRYALDLIGRSYDQIIQPWMFGHGETKATCLWLKGLPKLRPTNIVEGRVSMCHRQPPSPDRWKTRSRTYQGIADAMADQWGALE